MYYLNIEQNMELAGYIFLRKFYPQKSAIDIINYLGKAEKLGHLGPVSELKPARSENRPPNTYSGNYGLNEFPLHTDLAHWHIPPRFLVLRCIEGSSKVPTVLVDGFSIIKHVGIMGLARSLVKPRRSVQGMRSLLRICERQPVGGPILRWDEKYILPASPAGKEGMARFRAALACAPRLHLYLVNTGDTLLVDNWRMLHGRGSIPEDAINRTIARAYLGELYQHDHCLANGSGS